MHTFGLQGLPAFYFLIVPTFQHTLQSASSSWVNRKDDVMGPSVCRLHRSDEGMVIELKHWKPKLDIGSRPQKEGKVWPHTTFYVLQCQSVCMDLNCLCPENSLCGFLTSNHINLMTVLCDNETQLADFQMWQLFRNRGNVMH